jgi:hypothetical protein
MTEETKMSDNPLAAYFRGADVHQMLPTQGQFFDENEIELAINGEVAVLPMTAADEIILKNPDALLNGDALERLFKSCVPAIKAPRKISVPDMDVLLLAIKLASYGDTLEISTTCPNCKTESSFETSIRGILSDITLVKDEDTLVRIDDDMVVYLKPYDFESKTKLDLAAFEEAKLLQHLLSMDADDEEKAKLFNESFEKIAELNLDLLSHCIRHIQIPNKADAGKTIMVSDQKHIREFIRNADKNKIKKINEKLAHLSKSGVNRDIDVQCSNEECKHEWTTQMTFDAAHFFA